LTVISRFLFNSIIVCYLTLFATDVLRILININFCSHKTFKETALTALKTYKSSLHIFYLSLLRCFLLLFERCRRAGVESTFRPVMMASSSARMTPGFYLPIIKNNRSSSTIGINGSTRHTTHGHGPF